uniref:Reverse transcriptase zinc-binding domain-containing protein n=1 Tax=Quercus lobata TaxID=97700 RepID=A0A7N2KWM1_QUELO
MLENPNSLCYKVFKAYFFPDCSILDAKESASGSYAWKSILSVREVIEQGMVWRIGDGRFVCIKEDKWLLGPVARPVSSPLPDIPPDAKSQMGNFTTRNAYRLLVDGTLINNASSSNPNLPEVFLESCKDDLEDPLHIMWSCKKVKIIWSNLSWVNQKITSPPTDFSDLVSRFLQITDDQRREIFALAAWILWNQHNATQLGLPLKPLTRVISLASGMLQDLLHA